MDDLPVGLADPLHLLPPFPYRDLLWTVALLLLIACWWWWRRRRRPREEATAPPAPKPVPAPPSKIDLAIDDIARRTHEARAFRQGCHELAAVLRQYFETKLGEPLSTLTVKEIDDTVDRPWLAGCFRQLAKLQFARRVPEAPDFDDACDQARSAIERGGRR